jgi:hypothetical protein
METASIGNTFLDKIKKRKETFTGFVIDVSNALGLQIAITDIHDNDFVFLLSLRKEYNSETVNSSQFIFLTVALAFRQHSNHPDRHLDLIYVNHLMGMMSTVRKKKILSSQKIDFYQWFIKNRLK